MIPPRFRGRTAAAVTLGVGALAVLGFFLLAAQSPDGGENHTLTAPPSTSTSAPAEIPRDDDQDSSVSATPARDPFLQVVTAPAESTIATQSTTVPSPEPNGVTAPAPAPAAPTAEPAPATPQTTGSSSEPSTPAASEDPERLVDVPTGATPPAPPSETATSGLTVTTSGQSAAGQTVVLTARLSPVPTPAVAPSGTVTFRNGSTVLGSAPVVTGAATYATSGLAVGPHVLLASYDGDTTFASSTSAPVLHMVTPSTKAPSHVVLTVGPNLARFGQLVVLTATVSAPSPATTVPTGTVTFRSGNTVLGSSRLIAGRATYSASGLVAGPHVLVATYEGDANFAASTSAPVARVVGPAPPTTSSPKATSFGGITPARGARSAFTGGTV